jgi:hypothetical protein
VVCCACLTVRRECHRARATERAAEKTVPSPTTHTQRNTTVVCKPHFSRNDSWSHKNAFGFGNACVTVLNAATSQKKNSSGHRGNLGCPGADTDKNPRLPGNLGNPAPSRVTLITLITLITPWPLLSSIHPSNHPTIHPLSLLHD